MDAALRGRRVVVIDGSADVADEITRALRADGYDAHAAYDGADGIEAVALVRPDCVLIDVEMPRIDGFEVARCLRAVHRRSPLLVGMTGAPVGGEEAASRLAVFDLCLAKPLDLAALHSLLKAHRQPRAA